MLNGYPPEYAITRFGTFVPFGKEQKRGLDKEVFGNFFDGYFQVCTNQPSYFSIAVVAFTDLAVCNSGAYAY